jgi:pimeloyl-ACP methyl ester carboxylesterase
VPTPGLECAAVAVPLDYRHPGGATITVEISRLPSTNPAHRRGVLLLNPGGPGGPGLNLPVLLAGAGLPASVRETYDLIGFDPRGIEYSTPVSCGLSDVSTNIPPYAQNSADVARQAEVVRGIAARCGASASAPIIPFMNTASTARDMDRIRVALGEPKISYWGGSYGSYLGAVYSTLFANRTDRIVLDSITGPRGLDIDTSRRFGLGFQLRFPELAAWVAARNDVYGLGATPAAVTAKYFESAGRLDRTPVFGIDGSTFRQAIFGSLYSDDRFPAIAAAWHAVDTGQPPTALAAVPDVENEVSAQLSVVCNDNDWPSSVRTYQANVAVDRVRFPMFGASAANIWPCAFWPTEPIEPPVRISDRGPANILMVENLRDPATPITGALQTRAALGQRARFVAVNSGGHGVFVVGHNACGTRTVTDYLVTGALPAHDTLCPASVAAQGNPSALESILRRMLG